MPANSRFQ